MKKPTWLTATGIIMIIFGAYGIMGGAQKIILPTMLEMQKKFFQSISEAQKSNEDTNQNSTEHNSQNNNKVKPIDLNKFIGSIESMLQMPEWYKDWAIAIGLVSILVAVLYLTAGIFLLTIKPYAVNFLYFACATSIVWSLIQVIMYAQSNSAMLFGQIPNSIGGILIDIALIVVVAINYKTIFTTEMKPEES